MAGSRALTAIPGIGAALSNAVHGIPSFIFFMKEVGEIAEFIETGRMHKYDEVMAQRPHRE